jgi:SAM-dependent methyltransferase
MNDRDRTDGVKTGTPFDDGELYDVLFKDFTYGLDFYVPLAREAKAQGAVLDIACGTGRILLPCMQAGADGDGLDLHQPMLDRLRRNAAALGLSPNLYQADMSDFRLPRRYALIMITFNAFIHNVTQDAQIRCLTCCREHLLPGGVLAFDTYFPSLQILGGPQGRRELEGEVTDPRTGRLLRMFDTRRFDQVEQMQHSLTEIEEIDQSGAARVIQRSDFSVRWVYKAEMALLLRAAGFERWEIYGGFDRRALTKETDGMVVMAHLDTARKRAG